MVHSYSIIFTSPSSWYTSFHFYIKDSSKSGEPSELDSEHVQILQGTPWLERTQREGEDSVSETDIGRLTVSFKFVFLGKNRHE